MPLKALENRKINSKLSIKLNSLNKNKLFNRQDKKILKNTLYSEGFERITCSFYKYFKLTNVEEFRNNLYLKWSDFQILGRTYIASEGINAQISVPKHNFDKFYNHLKSISVLNDVKIKKGLEDNGKSFEKLIVRIKEKIVADGLKISNFDHTNIGKHLSATEFNKAMENEDSIVVDVRNFYESEVGRFDGAITTDSETFRESLPKIKKILENNKKKKILLYCTGGIRCEKASAYLKYHDFLDVNQLDGGIIDYAHKVKEKKISNKFKGKNFVFDKRLGENITEDILSNCYQCNKPSNTHTDCSFQPCHTLFIQCEDCSKKYEGCCSKECHEFSKFPKELHNKKWNLVKHNKSGKMMRPK